MAQQLRGIEDDPTLIRKTFAQFPSGVAVLAIEHEGERHAFVASSFMVGVSLEPCLVAVAVQNSSTTWDHMRHTRAIGVSIFGKGQGELTRKLASRDRAARFEQVAFEVDDSGAVFIEDAAVWLRCSVYQVTDAGDHWMALLQVDRADVSDKEPLIWHGSRFRELAEDDSIDITGVMCMPAAAWTP
jgi:flavin reductase (DIM6/NTAB) family NADH-FMN oxidoreductase RutF